MVSLPPLYALRAFEVAVRYGSFRQAAEVLHVTPGAVSRHIKTLEEWFGAPLFVRNGPKVTVSEQGDLFAQQITQGFLQLETACEQLKTQRYDLRLKGPSTLTIRWLLNALKYLDEKNSSLQVQLSSVWMEVDHVDFRVEPYDCAILLGNGDFGDNTTSALLFEEWLIPVCAPGVVNDAQSNLADCHLIHPTGDRRDWQYWLGKTHHTPRPDLGRGIVFDTLEQGNMAAMGGHGVSISDLRLSIPLVTAGLLEFPFSTATCTGDGYYLVWPTDSHHQESIVQLQAFLMQQLPPDIPDTMTLIGM